MQILHKVCNIQHIHVIESKSIQRENERYHRCVGPGGNAAKSSPALRATGYVAQPRELYAIDQRVAIVECHNLSGLVAHKAHYDSCKLKSVAINWFKFQTISWRMFETHNQNCFLRLYL